MPAKAEKTKTLNLALQGGGSHGAFTWGVLDALLEDGRLDFEGISATSAGAMNAAALAQGLNTGGHEKAREVLETFWREISEAGAFYNPMAQGENAFARFWNLDAYPGYTQFQAFLSQMMAASPYDFNPMNINPLRAVMQNVFDFKAIKSCTCVKLFINTTNVRNGMGEVFHNEDVDIDVLMASASLPLLFRATEIGDKAYWDGGYMGNPSLWPLFYNATVRDILIVHVNPICREEVPRDLAAIENRLNEITFNAALLKELRAISFVKRLINEDMLKDEYKDQYKDILLHAIRAEDVMLNLPVTSKYDTDWGFLTDLRDQGRREAQKWLKSHYKDIGQSASVNIQEDYLQ